MYHFCCWLPTSVLYVLDLSTQLSLSSLWLPSCARHLHGVHSPHPPIRYPKNELPFWLPLSDHHEESFSEIPSAHTLKTQDEDVFSIYSQEQDDYVIMFCVY